MRYLIAATLIAFGCSDGAEVRDGATGGAPQVAQEQKLGKQDEGVRAPAVSTNANGTVVATTDADDGDGNGEGDGDVHVSGDDDTAKRAPKVPAPATAPAPAPAPASTPAPVVPAADPDRLKAFDAAGLANGNCSLNGVPTLAAGTGTYTHMQGFTGAIGGNPVGMTSDGTAQFSYHARIATAPLDLTRMVDASSSRVVYGKKLEIPAGKSFRLKRVRFRACVGWDSNGHGDFVVDVNGTEIHRTAYDRSKPSIIVPPTSLDVNHLLAPADLGDLKMSFSNSAMVEVIAEGDVE